jgi:hypothetical protein
VISYKFHPDADAELEDASLFYESRIIARFPYSIIYRQDPGGIVIVAIAHQRRTPGYWRRRK